MHNKLLDSALHHSYVSKTEIIKIIKQYKKETNKKKKAKLLEVIFSNNVRMIKKLSYKFSNLYPDPEDAFQQACLGFFDALENFDCSKKFAFTTYLYYWVCKHIFEGNQKFLVNVPRNIQYLIQVLAKYKSICEHGDEKNHKKFLQNKMLQDEQIRDKYIKKHNGELDIQVIRMEDAVFTCDKRGRSLKYVDLMRDPNKSPDKIVEEKMRKEDIIKIIKDKLNDTEQQVIMRRFFKEGDITPYKDISEKMGKSIEGIRQIEKKAFTKLKRAISNKYSDAAPIMSLAVRNSG